MQTEPKSSRTACLPPDRADGQHICDEEGNLCPLTWGSLLHPELPAGSCSRGYLMTTRGRQPAAKRRRSRPVRRPAFNITASLPCLCSLPRDQHPAGVGCGLSPNPRRKLLEGAGPVSTQDPGKDSLKEQGMLSHSLGELI